jgi:hypothetical protein
VTDVRLAGGALLALGGFALYEGARLVGLRNEMLAGAVVGDDTLPLLVGVALVLLGGYLLLAGRVQAVRPQFPDAPTSRRMLGSALALAGYCAAMPHLGYTASTALAAVLLFRVMGAYRWPACLLLSAGVTGALYLLFRVWLKQPLPVGILGA